MNIYKYAPCQGCFFAPEYILFKILEKGLMLTNLPDALILQKKKPIKNTTKNSTWTFWPTRNTQAQPKGPESCGTDFMCCALSVTQSKSPFLKCLCAPLCNSFFIFSWHSQTSQKSLEDITGKKSTSKLTTYQAIKS